MSPTEIRRVRKELEAELSHAQAAVAAVKDKLAALVERCEHPLKYAVSASGRPSNYCPDCGGNDV